MNQSGNGSAVCQPPSLLDPTTEWIFTYLYPATLATCLVGNCLNLVIYIQPLLKTSTTIRLLSAKSVANSLYMLSLIVQSFNLRGSEHLAWFTWQTLRQFFFLANLFGNTATWLTVAITAESFIAIALPMQASTISTMPHANIAILTSALASAVLHASLIFNRRLLICPCDRAIGGQCREASWSDHGNETEMYSFQIRSNAYYKLYNWVSSSLGVLVPIIALLLLCIALRIVTSRHRSFQSSSEQKKCVIRLTTATALSHLLLELPQAFVFIFTGVTGNSEDPLIQAIHPVVNYLTMLNSSISFFIYYACSERFRDLCHRQLCPCLVAAAPPTAVTGAYLEMRRQTVAGPAVRPSSYPRARLRSLCSWTSVRSRGVQSNHFGRQLPPEQTQRRRKSDNSLANGDAALALISERSPREPRDIDL